MSVQLEPPGVERRRVELGAELRHRSERVVVEHVLDDAHRRVVVERHVDVCRGDDVDRHTQARRAPHREPDRAAPHGRARAARTSRGTPAAAAPPGSRRSSRATPPLRSVGPRDRRTRPRPARAGRSSGSGTRASRARAAPSRARRARRDRGARRRTRTRSERGRPPDALRPAAGRAPGSRGAAPGTHRGPDTRTCSGC